MEKNTQNITTKGQQRLSPELVEVLKMLSALEAREVSAPVKKSA